MLKSCFWYSADDGKTKKVFSLIPTKHPIPIIKDVLRWMKKIDLYGNNPAPIDFIDKLS
jgi:hypothetical protein